MEISVLLEPLNSSGFRATSLAPVQLVAQGETRQDALNQLRDMVRKQLGQAEIVKLDVPLPGETHPWLQIFGKLKDHPDIAEVEENIREYRRQVDLDPNR